MSHQPGGINPETAITDQTTTENGMDLQKLVLEIEQQIIAKASLPAAFEGLIRQLTEVNAMPLKLERFPGGRWFRDLGESTGHLWGFVQVIKPPTLLEIQGPMFMSYPVSGHVQFRLAEVPGGTRVTVRYRALGLIEDAHREGVVKGWQDTLKGIEGNS
jgi:activator of Hsp90 ATPase-like protein